MTKAVSTVISGSIALPALFAPDKDTTRCGAEGARSRCLCPGRALLGVMGRSARVLNRG